MTGQRGSSCQQPNQKRIQWMTPSLPSFWPYYQPKGPWTSDVPAWSAMGTSLTTICLSANSRIFSNVGPRCGWRMELWDVGAAVTKPGPTMLASTSSQQGGLSATPWWIQILVHSLQNVLGKAAQEPPQAVCWVANGWARKLPKHWRPRKKRSAMQRDSSDRRLVTLRRSTWWRSAANTFSSSSAFLAASWHRQLSGSALSAEKARKLWSSGMAGTV